MSTIPHGKLQKCFFFNLVVPALFSGFAFCFMPLRQAFRFDNDEGLELIKASLYSEGFSLYTQIWNDQPPLLTVLLSHWFDLFGKSIFAGRLLILSFSTILVWAFCQTLRMSLGSLSALVGTLLLVVSYKYLELSASVMFGLPALALAMLSIYTLMLYKREPRKSLMIVSGSLLALSLQTKLFTVFFIPLLSFELLDFRIREPEIQKAQDRRFSMLLWFGSLLVVFTFIGLLLHSLSYEQLLQANLGQNVKSAFRDESLQRVILPMMLQDIDCLFLAILGISVVFVKQQWEKIFPLVWLVTVTLLLLNYKPVWYHYYLLFSIPLTWLATYGATSVFSFLREHWDSIKPLNLKKLLLPGLAAAFLMLSLIGIPIKMAIAQGENQASVEEHKLNIEVVDRLLAHKQSTQWVFTDLPIYAFYTGLRVPPEIAVFSRKRLLSGNLTVDKLLLILQTYHPEQIVLGRFPEIHRGLSPYIHKNYLKTYESSSVTYYLEK